MLEPVIEIDIGNHKAKARHSKDYVQLRFMPGSFAIEEERPGYDGQKVLRGTGYASVIMTPEETLDLITMLKYHYEEVCDGFEQYRR